MRETDSREFEIPEQMNIHRFINGLKNSNIKEKLFAETFKTNSQECHIVSDLRDLIITTK